ncbi:MAG: glycoside hydrolase family 75 protein [Verrucomicrobiales bacterium]|nr:glycoside hydrolase family 75 protein [Verrucomicrobiales bacterium]
MNDKEEFFISDEDAPPRRTAPRKKKMGCFGKLILLGLLGLAFFIGLLVLIDATNSGGTVKKILVEILGGQTEAPRQVEPIIREKIVEVPVETVVEKVVEKIVEVEVLPPMPSSYVSWKKVDVAELWSDIPVKTEVISEQGDIASREREKDGSYGIEMKLKLTVPKPNQSAKELSGINENLPKMLNDFDALVSKAEVSPFFHHLYELKTRYIQERVTRIDRLLSRHNLYDLETVLQVAHPETGQKLLLVQGEMDVVTDGSDGDRWPMLDDYISMSQYYQPFTSYGWGKRSTTPNPLLERWETKLAEYETEFAISGLSIERNRYLRSQIDTLTAEVADMKVRSYLIAEADPFFVLPLSFLGRTDENEFGPSIGDYGVIIHGDNMYPAIAGDAGPSWKFGEASLRVAKALNEKATPYNRPVSDLVVTYLIFPGSRDETKGPPDLEAWRARCQELLDGIGGIGEGYQLHQWEDLIAKKKAEQEAAAAAEETEEVESPPAGDDSGDEDPAQPEKGADQ